MPAFEWVHVQLHQQKGMISLSPPTICNSARICTGPSTAGAALSIFISPPVVTAKLHTGFWVKSSTT
ncbi:insB3 domain protein [Acinetobacter baumannii 1075025]|nr:insB3 domain protein [Acinetobacter baumannii 1075025]EXG09361.1 insB3 domain protein [Acinetobacter baumannii 472237-120]EXR39532.1 insB3 domain protein [Acinetobacter baumannii 1276470-86]EZI32622.1 putative transposase domain protein [Acinetobacter baumannii 45052_4]